MEISEENFITEIDDLESEIQQAFNRRKQVAVALQQSENRRSAIHSSISAQSSVSHIDDAAIIMGKALFIAAGNSYFRASNMNIIQKHKTDGIEVCYMNKEEKEDLASIIHSLFMKTYDHPINKGLEKPFDLWKKVDIEASFDYDLDEKDERTNSTCDFTPGESKTTIIGKETVTKCLLANIKNKQEAEKQSVLPVPNYDATLNYGFALNDNASTYPFERYDQLNDVVWDSPKIGTDRELKGCTLPVMVEELTRESNVDLNLRSVILMTHKSFCTAQELLNLLKRRIYLPSPHNLTPNELEHFNKQKQAHIQLKTIGVMKFWIDEYWEEFLENPELLENIKNFIASVIEEEPSVWATRAAKDVRKLIRSKESGAAKTIKTDFTCPKPMIKPGLTLSEFSLLEANESEISRQITITDWKHFRSLEVSECLNKAWSKPEKHKLAPNIVDLTTRFNDVSNWVQLEVLAYESLPRRATMLKKFVHIADQCRSLSNYHSAFSIYCGLNSSAIHRLHKSWAEVDKPTKAKFDELDELFNPVPNFSNLRKAQQQAPTPCIPHLGTFLTDLTYIEDAKSNINSRLINFTKRKQLAERIQWLCYFQQGDFNFAIVPIIQEYLKIQLESAKQPNISDFLWQLSMKVEPRERKPPVPQPVEDE